MTRNGPKLTKLSENWSQSTKIYQKMTEIHHRVGARERFAFKKLRTFLRQNHTEISEILKF